LKRPSAASSLIFGGLNGLLPCGLLYVALSAAVATGSVQSAAMFMLVFGISTMPLMLFLVLFSTQLSLQYRNAMRRWLPVFTAVVAVLLILRGLDLGIPYVSPHIENLPASSRGAEAVICH
jgi:sulfite exporter TauE/SafE